MVTQSTALKIAQDYLHEVRALGVGVKKAILFGSFAKNRQHEWSDIDLALFGDDFIGLTALDKERFRSLHWTLFPFDRNGLAREDGSKIGDGKRGGCGGVAITGGLSFLLPVLLPVPY